MNRSGAWFGAESRAVRVAPEQLVRISRSQAALPVLGRFAQILSLLAHEIAMPAMLSSPYVLPVLMLIGSNVFMTLAWYGHLRFKEVPLAGVIFAAWGIALVEYCLAVPANRWGNEVYSTAQLKTMQEVITLLVFAAFSVLYLKEPFGWHHALGFSLIALGAFFIFQKW
jgi:uncharacterized protein (DUF486 family)